MKSLKKILAAVLVLSLLAGFSSVASFATENDNLSAEEVNKYASFSIEVNGILYKGKFVGHKAFIESLKPSKPDSYNIIKISIPEKIEGCEVTHFCGVIKDFPKLEVLEFPDNLEEFNLLNIDTEVSSCVVYLPQPLMERNILRVCDMSKIKVLSKNCNLEEFSRATCTPGEAAAGSWCSIM